ncbi:MULTISPECIES: hypothetical protein [Convivina]|nr:MULTISPECIES: hypothetical protein [Convivina]
MAGHFIVPLVILYFSIKSWFEMLGENEIKINAIKRVVLSLFYGMTFFIIGTSVTATWLVAYHSGKVHIKQPEYKQSSEEDNISFGFWKAADYLRQNKSIRFA